MTAAGAGTLSKARQPIFADTHRRLLYRLCSLAARSCLPSNFDWQTKSLNLSFRDIYRTFISPELKHVLELPVGLGRRDALSW